MLGKGNREISASVDGYVESATRFVGADDDDDGVMFSFWFCPGDAGREGQGVARCWGVACFVGAACRCESL